MALGARYQPQFDNAVTLSNAPVAAAELTFYNGDTATLADTYSDAGLTTKNTNPVIADGGGVFPAIYLDPAITYKAVKRYPTVSGITGAVISSVFPVFAANSRSIANTQPSFSIRNAVNAALAAAFPNGTTVSIAGYSYLVDPTATGPASCTHDLGVDGLVPDVTVYPQHYGAVGDGVNDDSSSIQSAINAITAVGGGTLLFPSGTFLFQNVQLKANVGIRGVGRLSYGFSEDKGTTFKLPASATKTGVAAVEINSGGSGYTSAPAVIFSSGSAAAVATVSGGAVVAVYMTDPGNYIDGIAPTISFSGGGGTGATASAHMAARLFFTSGSKLNCLSFSDFTMQGPNAADTQGIHLHNTYAPTVRNVSGFLFGLEAVRSDAGQGFDMSDVLLFGCATTRSTGYRTGTFRIGGTDSVLSHFEIGASPCGDSSALLNCAVFIDKTASAMMWSNGVAEGADAGIYCEGNTGRFVNIRADINYGHGWWYNRSDPSYSPPSRNRMTNCWGHRNSRYTTNTFDNFHIQESQSISGISMVNCESGTSSGDAWKARWGIWDGTTDIIVSAMSYSGFEATGTYHNAAGTSNASPVQNKNALYALTGAASIDVTGKREVQINAPGSPVNLATLSGGNHGDELTLWFNCTNVTIVHGSISGSGALRLAGGQNRTPGQWDSAHFVNRAGTWIEFQPWAKQAAITSPSGGATIDTQARTAIDAIRAALTAAGITS